MFAVGECKRVDAAREQSSVLVENQVERGPQIFQALDVIDFILGNVNAFFAQIGKELFSCGAATLQKATGGSVKKRRTPAFLAKCPEKAVSKMYRLDLAARDETPHIAANLLG